MDYKTLLELTGKGILKYHHSSLAKGYLKVGSHHFSEYNGRFGKGFIYHASTKYSLNCGNNNHMITYFIYAKNN